MEDQREQIPQFHPIESLPELAVLIDDYVRDADEIWNDLAPARARPHILDEYTLDRVRDVYAEGLEIFQCFEQQPALWQEGRPTGPIAVEVERLQGQVTAYRRTAVRLLELAEELRGKTIEAIMGMDDVEVALRFLAGELLGGGGASGEGPGAANDR